MRVGLMSPYSLTIPGGVQGQVMGLARALAAAGVRVRVLGPCDGPPPDASVTPLGNSIPTAANGSVAPLAPDPAAQLRTLSALWDEQFDVLHLHEPVAPGPTQTALLIKPAPVIATFHAAGRSNSYESLGRPLRWMASRIDLRCAVSDDAVELVQPSLGGEYDIIGNAVELARYRVDEPWPTTGPTVFFCGRHEPRKGLAVLIEAMADLPADNRLWVGSDGPETEALRQAAAGDPRVEWLGRITEEEKHRRLAGADVFCAPSLRGESFGVVLIEAMAAGTAIVASDLPGYAKVARSGRDALLVEPGDPRVLAKALSRLLGDEGERRRLIAEGSTRAEQFSMRVQAEAYMARYERLIGT